MVEAFNFVDPVEENFKGSMSLLMEGALLAVLVVWLFLRDWRATLVSAAALPLSIIPAFLAMYLFNFTINMVTLLSLSLVVGILVDDAIVEIENIVRHMRKGKEPYQAAMEAADEIGLAVIATTFTLIAVFLPTAFMSGVPGKFFVQFGWTAAIAVFFSLVVARMLTPMMAAYLLKAPKKEHAEPRLDEDLHELGRLVPEAPLEDDARGAGVLRRLLRAGAAAADRLHPARRPVADAGLPRPCRRAARSRRRSPPPSRRARSCRRTRTSKLVYTAVGGGASGGDPFSPRGAAEVRKATLTINMTPRKERGGGRASRRSSARCARRSPSCPARASTSAWAGRRRSTCWCWRARTAPRCRSTPRIVERELRTIPGIGNITSTASLVRPELVVRPDFARAADLGVTSAAIADTLRIATAGDYDQGLRQAQPVAAPDADRGEAAAGGAPGPVAARSGCRCPPRAAAA